MHYRILVVVVASSKVSCFALEVGEGREESELARDRHRHQRRNARAGKFLSGVIHSSISFMDCILCPIMFKIYSACTTQTYEITNGNYGFLV